MSWVARDSNFARSLAVSLAGRGSLTSNLKFDQARLGFLSPVSVYIGIYIRCLHTFWCSYSSNPCQHFHASSLTHCTLFAGPTPPCDDITEHMYCPYVCEMIWMVENPIRATDSKHLRLLTQLQLVADFQQSYQTDSKFKPPPPQAPRMRSKSWWLSKSKRVKNRSFKFRAVVLHFSFQQSVPDALESEMKWELFKKSCQFRTKNFRQHGDNIRAAIHFEDQEFAMFTCGIENLVLSFTDNEGEATNICLVHIDPHGKLNISLQWS